MKGEAVLKMPTCLVLGLALGLPTMLLGAWPEEQIADALRAAPPNVTEDATIYAFKADGERVLVRSGTGSYTCVASGYWPTRPAASGSGDGTDSMVIDTSRRFIATLPAWSAAMMRSV